MKNSKSIRAFAALLILIYHLWISLLPGSVVENYLRYAAFLGVDIFFFMSGFSLAGREIESYKKFVLDRFWAVYFKFILLAVVAFFWSNWTLKRLAMVVIGAELFTKGGGSFLWFLPAIMLLYLLFPLFSKAYAKKPLQALLSTVVIWLIVAGTGSLLDFKNIFIFVNRIPVFFAGFLIATYGSSLMNKNMLRLIAGLILTNIGLVFLYYWGFKVRLQVPFVDTFYILAMVPAIGLVLLVSFVPENGIIGLISKASLEMYGIQMIFGFKLANLICRYVKNNFLANIMIIVIITMVAIIVQRLWGRTHRRFNSR